MIKWVLSFLFLVLIFAVLNMYEYLMEQKDDKT